MAGGCNQTRYKFDHLRPRLKRPYRNDAGKIQRVCRTQQSAVRLSKRIVR